jgi:hypothetical protein
MGESKMWTGLAVYCPYGTKTLSTCTPVRARSQIEDEDDDEDD